MKQIKQMARENEKKKKSSNDILSITIATSMSEIIQFSVDDDFRKRSFKVLGVIGAKDVENEVYKKLSTFTENSNSLVPQKVTSTDESENQQVQSQQTNFSEDLFQSEEECESLNEYSPDFSQTVFSQICLQISQEQEERRLKVKTILSNTKSGIITPEIYENLFSQPTI